MILIVLVNFTFKGIIIFIIIFKRSSLGTSLVMQWLRICLPIKGTRVRALVWEDTACPRATKPVSHGCWAQVPQLLKPAHLEPVLCNRRGCRNERPVHRGEEWPLLAATRESPHAAEDSMQPKIILKSQVFIFIWLRWVFVAVGGLLTAVASLVAEHRLSCSAACGIFPDLNLCPLHWQADS